MMMGIFVIISQSLMARFITKVFAGVLRERHLKKEWKKKRKKWKAELSFHVCEDT